MALKPHIKTRLYDPAEFLTDEETIQAYLAETLRTGDQGDFLEALNTVARARGMTQLAKYSGLSRESLYKTLSRDSKSRFETIQAILKALNLTLIPTIATTTETEANVRA
ncbi:addiction module antitoxin [Pasteurellaceae bacterium Macca]|nr:addiction module antitoxin [Pasteurellaceae bacterium Macca]